MALAENATHLKIEALIGFNGGVYHGLQYTPDGKYVVYPLGAMIVIKNLASDTQAFLEGHNNVVSTLSISHDGTKLASGEIGLTPGTKADVIVWDLAKAKKYADANDPSAGGLVLTRLRMHLGKVQDLDWSCRDDFLATLGGQDDNTVLVWKLDESRAICGAPAGPDQTLCVKWLNQRNDRFITGGYFSLRVWQVDASFPRMHFMEAKMGTLRRMIQCAAISHDDKYAYCGTKTGDLVRVRIDRDPIPRSFNEPDKVRPMFDAISKERFGKGIKSVACFVNPATGNTNTVVGAGDGRVAVINPSMSTVSGKSTELSGAVTSVSLSPDGKGFLAGTNLSNRYFVTFDFAVELRATCHHGPINAVVFPNNCSDLFVTCSINDIRVWNSKLRQEVLRIQVPNLECKAVDITANGGTIVTGWSDGRVRAFYPESGKLKFVIPNAHHESVTALAICNDDETRPPWRLVTGGQDGRVRVWNVTSSHQVMIFSAKDHRGAINAIKVTNDNRQCVSASADGSCIIWDLVKKVRLAAFVEPTIFKSVLYHPEESQILTCGTNFKVAYYDAYDGTAIRVVEGGSAAMTSLDIVKGGKYFVSGGADKKIKVWEYDDGLVVGTGRGHSGTVSAVKFSPDETRVVSVGEEGGIFIWKLDLPK